MYLDENELNLLDRIVDGCPDFFRGDKAFPGLQRAINNALAERRAREVPPLTKTELQTLQDTLIHYVTTKTPHDLVESHDGDWFFRKNNKVYWNWRCDTMPLHCLIEKCGFNMQSYVNTPNHDLYDLVNRVKRHKLVKPIKDRAKAQGDLLTH